MALSRLLFVQPRGACLLSQINLVGIFLAGGYIDQCIGPLRLECLAVAGETGAGTFSSFFFFSKEVFIGIG